MNQYRITHASGASYVAVSANSVAEALAMRITESGRTVAEMLGEDTQVRVIPPQPECYFCGRQVPCDVYEGEPCRQSGHVSTRAICEECVAENERDDAAFDRWMDEQMAMRGQS